MNSTIIITQTGSSIFKVIIAKAAAAAATIRSAVIMTFLRLQRSTSTPITGPPNACGRKPTSVAMDSTIAEPVFAVKYQMIAIWRMALVMIETA
ncbi:hypothetical protein D3C78_1125620 [compost metagenome]